VQIYYEVRSGSMMYNDRPNKEGIQPAQMLFDMDRLSVLSAFSQSEPALCLKAILNACVHGKEQEAVRSYYALTHALIQHPMQRVSGDLWKDFILYSILEEENAFSKSGANRAWDALLCEMVRKDFAVLRALYELEDTGIKKLILSSMKARRKEPVSIGVRWEGDKVAKIAPQKKNGPEAAIALSEEDWPSWGYRPAGMECYAAREAMAMMHKIFMQEEDWPSLADELWSLHNICGTGYFIRYKHFLFDGALHPVHCPAVVSYDDLFGLDSHKQLLLRNMSRFISGESYHHVVITGPKGMGKTLLAHAMMGDGSTALRVIHMAAEELDLQALNRLLGILKQQPFRYILFFDGLTANAQVLALINRMAGNMELGNVMLCATSDMAQGLSEFTLEVRLESLSKPMFIEMVAHLLHKRGLTIRRDRITRMYASDITEGATCRQAVALATMIETENAGK
jgi:hypothetical protein